MLRAIPLVGLLILATSYSPASATTVCVGELCLTPPAGPPTYEQCTLYVYDRASAALYCNLSQGGWLNFTHGAGGSQIVTCGTGTFGTGCMGFWPVPWMLP